MKNYDIVVVGGSAGGLTAAITARRQYPDKSILVIRRDEKALVPCGIPYIFGTLSSIDENVMGDGIYAKNNMELIIDKVTDIDRDAKVVFAKNEGEIKYAKMIFAPGSKPLTPPIKGIDKKGVFSVKKDYYYLKNLKEEIEKVEKIAIIGGGFIGVEFADEIRKKGKDVSIIEMLPHCLMIAFDEDISIKAEKLLEQNGVKLYTNEKVVEFGGTDKVERIILASGKEIETDLVIVAIGALPNTELAEKIGLELGPTKAIAVDRYMRTSDPNIFSAGDCAEKVSFFDGKPSKLRLASIATMEARIAGANLFGVHRINMGTLGVFSTVVDDTAFALAGLSEHAAKEKGYNVVIGEAETVNRHPGSMPGAEKLSVRLIFEKGSKILIGGEVVGAKGSAEVVNILSALIQQRVPAYEIATFQMGTHPALTASPVGYQLVTAAEIALRK